VALAHAGEVAPARPAPVAATPAITRAELEAHVRTLAADELRGRFTGTPEAVRAAEYLAASLKGSGVEPAGDGGTFLQRVPIERRRVTKAPELRVTPVEGAPFTAEHGVDFQLSPPNAVLTTPALRIVRVASAGELPAEADPAVALFFDGSSAERRSALPRRVRAGTKTWGLQVGRGTGQPGKARAHSDAWSQAGAPASSASVWLELNGTLLGRAQKGELAALELKTFAERETLDAFNVLGVVRGQGTQADPAAKDEVVVVSAHYDHLHEDDAAAPGDGVDRIYNGADDDASGCAVLLELAGRLAADPPPARTILFLFATGEEIGLVGTEHYLDHPPFPLAKTVLNLNFEMVGRPDPKAGGAGKLWLTGHELSNLGAACAAAGVPVVADPHPDQQFFWRSDNIAFVRRGIVGQTLSSYGLHADYHAVTDEADTLDYAHLEGGAKAGHAALVLVASGALRPAWLEGKDPNARPSRRPRREEPK
jgi:hypothetical protein